VTETRRATGEVRWLGGTEPETALANRPAADLPQSALGFCPTTPCGVQNRVNDEYRQHVRDNPNQPHGVFEESWGDLTNPFTNKQVQADVYEVLALLPAVRYDGDWVYLDTALSGGRLRLRVDEASGRFLGYERLSESPSRLPPNTVLESMEITVESVDRLPG
jgi:hypothetical protein